MVDQNIIQQLRVVLHKATDISVVSSVEGDNLKYDIKITIPMEVNNIGADVGLVLKPERRISI